MNEELNALFQEKLKVVLNLIRTNNQPDDALKITQAADNLVRARNSAFSGKLEETKTTRKQGSNA